MSEIPMKQRKAAVAVIRDKGQVTIPSGIRRAAHLGEGDSVEVVITADGILLRPRKLVDATQAWFWTPDWQKAEQEASDDIRKGRTRTYKTDRDFLRRFAK
jgi:AbrB family looped-hinge helix DNA binding protein